MSRKLSLLSVVACLMVCASGRADFKYTQTTQMTGGAMAGAMKTMGIFSKSARQATKPTETTTYVKGNHLRTDNADGTYQIIDLDGRRFIQVDPAHQTYNIMTFEQMRQMIEQMQQRMSEAGKQQKSQAGQNGENAQMTLTPKIQISSTGKTQSILGQDTQEMLVNMDLEMQSTDAQNGMQSGTLRTQIDEWLAPSIIGYHEISDFYKKMAAEIGWTPQTFGINPQMAKSMVELNKSGKIPVGLPMMSTVNMMGAAPQGGEAAQQQQQQQNQQQSSSGMSDALNPSGAAVKALGGMFARRRKKQQQEEEEAQNGSAPVPAAPPGALMSITTRVTSFSTDSLDDGLFQIPSGYNQIQPNLNRYPQRGAQ